MGRADAIVIDALDRASVRIHWVFLGNLILTALVLQSILTDRFSFDQALINAAQIFVIDIEKQLQEIEQLYEGSIPLKKPNGRVVKLSSPKGWSTEHLQRYGTLTARQQRAMNFLKENNFSTAQTPIIAMKISASDLPIICGALMVMLSLWILMMTNKVFYFVSGAATYPAIGRNIKVIKHLIVTFHSTSFALRSIVTLFVVYLPFLSISLSAYYSFDAGQRLRASTYWPIVAEAYPRALAIEVGLSVFLFVLATAITTIWYCVLHKLNAALPSSAR